MQDVEAIPDNMLNTNNIWKSFLKFMSDARSLTFQKTFPENLKSQGLHSYLRKYFQMLLVVKEREI